jgi:hypothetical protein
MWTLILFIHSLTVDDRKLFIKINIILASLYSTIDALTARRTGLLLNIHNHVHF